MRIPGYRNAYSCLVHSNANDEPVPNKLKIGYCLRLNNDTE